MKGSIANPGVGPHVQATLNAYQEYDLIDTFYTTLYHKPETSYKQLLNKFFPAFAKQLQRRSLKNAVNFSVKSITRYELLRIFSAKTFPPQLTDLVWELGELAFDNWVAKQLKKDNQWIHTYEHCSLSTLQQAKKLGIKTFYEQPSQHFSFFEKIAKEQIKKYPELKSAETELLINRKSKRRNQRRAEELNICNYIICNSTFTAKTLADAQVAAEKIITLPLAFPDPIKSLTLKNNPAKTIFIYAGNLSLRKGTHLLYQAWQKCNFQSTEAELWLIGSNQLPLTIRKGLGEEVKFIPNLPHADLMQLFKEADVLVLPTLCDGFGMVITEAMAHGLTVITTYNSGGPDIITSCKNGLLAEAGNVEQLTEQLKWCIQNKSQLNEMRRNALEKANSYSWADFRQNLIKEIIRRIDLSPN